MVHFAVIAPPLRGHYRPLSHLAAELIERGHQVTFVHQEEARSLVEADGARFSAIGCDAAPVESWTRPMARIRGIIGLGRMMKRMERFTTMFCTEAPRRLRELGIDAVICDQLEPGGGLVAEHLGIPWVSVASTIPMNRELGIPPPFVGWRYDASDRAVGRNRGGWRVSDLLLRGFNRTIAANAKALGLPPRTRIEHCFSPYLQLAQQVPSLDFPRFELPANFHSVGVLRRPSAIADFPLPDCGGRPWVFATLGTLQGSRVVIFRRIAEACRWLGLKLVLTQGGRGKDKLVEQLPGNALAFDWVPTEAVLAQVELVVCHAGINTVLEPLAAGLPLVVMPLAFDQPAVAARIARSGAGIMLSRRASTEKLAEAIRRIEEDPSYRQRAQAIGRELRAAGGVARAADLIEQALGPAARKAGATTECAGPDDVRGDSRNDSSSAGSRAS